MSEERRKRVDDAHESFAEGKEVNGIRKLVNGAVEAVTKLQYLQVSW